MTITVQVRGGKQVESKLERGPARLTALIARTVKAEAFNVLSVVKNKLSDDVLHVRTGRLRRSITAQFEEGETSIRARVGTNVKYARVHELGFRGTVQVKEHLRMQVTAWGRPMKNPRNVTVKAHPMQMNTPARPFLRPALEENEERIKTNVRKAIAEGLR